MESEDCIMMNKRNIKRILVLVLLVTLISASTINVYAASGTVSYRYTKNHVLIVPLDVPTSVGVTIKVNVDYHYNASDTQSRTYDNEEYFMSAESINAPSVTRELTFGLGTLEVYPVNASVKRCTKSYTPSTIWPSGLLFHDAKGSNTTINVLKQGNSYGKLGYSVDGNVVVSASGIVTCNNLGTAVGTVTTNSLGNEFMSTSLVETNDNKINVYEARQLTRVINEKTKDPAHSEAIKAFQRRNSSLLLYAEENGLVATKEDVEKYIEKLIENFKTAENMPTVEKAYLDAGTTYEKAVKGDYEVYKILLTEENVYEDFLENYINKHNLKDTEITKGLQDQIYLEWDRFIDNINNEYSI